MTSHGPERIRMTLEVILAIRQVMWELSVFLRWFGAVVQFM